MNFPDFLAECVHQYGRARNREEACGGRVQSLHVGSLPLWSGMVYDRWRDAGSPELSGAFELPRAHRLPSFLEEVFFGGRPDGEWGQVYTELLAQCTPLTISRLVHARFLLGDEALFLSQHVLASTEWSGAGIGVADPVTRFYEGLSPFPECALYRGRRYLSASGMVAQALIDAGSFRDVPGSLTHAILSGSLGKIAPDPASGNQIPEPVIHALVD